MEEFAYQLSLLTDQAYFLSTEPETPDFTDNKSWNFVVCSQKKKITVVVDKESLPIFLGILTQTIFTQPAIFIWWNKKSFNSYCLFHLKKIPQLAGFDLKVIESFANIEKIKPENLIEAINRLKAVTGWKPLYQNLHEPLISEVIPNIEVTGLLNIEKRQAEYSYYEIEGTHHGRMSSSKQFVRSFLPHTLSDDNKKVLKPRNNELYIYADIKSCEIKTLQWLTKDPILTDIVNTNQDMYKQIYELITADTCDSDNKRGLSKKLILPVIYGCGVNRLSELLLIGVNECKDLISRTKRVFSKAFEWMDKIQDGAYEGKTTDLFGRVRDFSKEPYKARNFIVQGTATTACQEKLIELHRNLKNYGKICFTLHDGYGIVTPIITAKETIKITKSTLESECKLCPGLKFNCDIKFGRDLYNLKC